MISFIFSSLLLIFSVYASFDLLLPPLPPSGLHTQKDSRAKFTEAINKALKEFWKLPLTDDQRVNLNKLLFVYIKAYAYRYCAPNFVAVGKSSFITNLLFYTLNYDIITKESESDFINWTTLQNRFNCSYIFLHVKNAGHYLTDIIKSFEMLFPADSKELEEYIGDSVVFNEALIYINKFKSTFAIKALEPQRLTKILEKIDLLKKKLKDSLFADHKLGPYDPIFEPLRGQLGRTFARFSYSFLEYAYAAFYEEHFSSNQELSEALFGTGVQLTDLNGKEINWCFEIASLSKAYLLKLKEGFPFIEDDSILLQLKRAIFDLLEPHKRDPKSFVVNLEQTRYFSLSN
jgi:hypothetical protein